MSFGDVSTPAGLTKLNEHLKNSSFIQGYELSSLDALTFEALNTAPTASHPHALRWYKHVQSFGDLRKKFPAATGGAGNGLVAATADEDEDVDLFGSDDEEEDAEAAKVREARLAAYADKKGKKPALVAKSNVILDVKPWSDETDMKELETAVRSITMDGLLWGVSKLVPLAYGIKKLQITTVVEDDKVSIEELTEKIEAFEDFIQSVDIAAFNKI